MTPGGVINDKEMEMLLIEKKKSDKLSDLIVASGLGFVVRLNGQKKFIRIYWYRSRFTDRLHQLVLDDHMWSYEQTKTNQKRFG